MLVRITDYCTMGCTHCMVNAGESGGHMDMEMFKWAFDFSVFFDMYLFLSGGEPTSHPQFIDMLEFIRNAKIPFFKVLILSNGMFLEDKKYTDKILGFGYQVQISNDSRFYPKRVKEVKHPLLTYVNRITQVAPFGRAIENKIDIDQRFPGCFNLRSFAQKFDSFREVIFDLRYPAGKFCTPSINTDGSISAGETPFCSLIGTVNSTGDELLNNIRSMSCNSCGLDKNLTGEHAVWWKKMNREKGCERK